jgi:hypothetical protein
MQDVLFDIRHNLLILTYTPQNNANWVLENLKKNNSVIIKDTFHFISNDLFDKDELNNFEYDKTIEKFTYEVESVQFIIGTIEDNYIKFYSEVLDISYVLYISKDLYLKKEYFVAKGNISIFSKINNLLSSNIQAIRIGNNEDDTFTIEYFKSMIKNFPTKTELEHYYNARLNVIIKEYIETKKDSEDIYKKYMLKKPSIKGENIVTFFKSYEKDKYTKILDKLNYMLDNEAKYKEKDWQNEILQIVQFIFPKYIRIFDNVSIKDTELGRTKYLDFMLVDSNGNIDIAEIKQPFSNKNIVSNNVYRNNYIPLRELSGSIMQIEKYIYNLTRWGDKGEMDLTNKYKNDLPINFKIKIINPNGLIIMGRDDKLSSEQKKDFEIIKRKYKNVIDILTYDDLLRRIQIILEAL